MGLLNSSLMRHALSSAPVVSVLKRVAPAMDKFLLRISRGHINTAMQPVVLLRTTGARSGEVREIATLCMPSGEDLILVGSNWGQAKDPAWVHNLRATPQAAVWFRGYVGPVWAQELDAAAREALWPTLIDYNPQYARYQEMTERRLPVIRLQRMPGATGY